MSSLTRFRCVFFRGKIYQDCRYHFNLTPLFIMFNFSIHHFFLDNGVCFSLEYFRVCNKTPRAKGNNDKITGSSTSRHGASTVYHDGKCCPVDRLYCEIVSDTSQCPTLCQSPSRQGGREMSAPRPYETDPLHPHSSIHILF